MDESFEKMRDSLVEAALVHVPFDGWSHTSLTRAAEDLGLDATMPERLFPKGAVEAVDQWADLADRRMETEALDAGLDEKRLDVRIAWLVRHRLEAWGEHKESVRRAIALLAMPGNNTRALKITWRTADAIWHAANDRSADFSYYTKRAMLAGIYTATLMFWLQDDSENDADSWAFLDRRLVGALMITKARRHLSARLGRLSLRGLLPTRAGRRRFGIRG